MAKKQSRESSKKTVKKHAAKSAGLITADMSIQEVVSRWPSTAQVFAEHGMHCLGCAIAAFESIELGARAHGMDIVKLLKALNAVAAKKK